MNQATELKMIMRRALIDIGVYSLMINLLLLVMPLYLLQVYDRVLPSASMETLVFLSLIAVGALVFLGLMEIVRSLYAQRVALSFDRNVGSTVFASLFDPKRAAAGDIQPLRDLATIRNFIGSKGLTTLFDLPFAPLFVVLLFFIHPVLFWITLAGAAVMLLIMFANQTAAAGSGLKAAEQSAAANLAAQAFARNVDSLRAMGMLSNATEFWGGRFAESLRSQGQAASVNATFSGVSRATRMMLQLAILGVGALLVLRGEMTAGMIFASSIISGRALQPLDQLIGGWRQTVDARQAWHRLKNVTEHRPDSASRKIELPTPKGAVTARNLVFAAPGAVPGADPILKRISFAIEAGEAVALIGPSRAGKTTLARLLVGAAAPTGGTVKIDGADLMTWDEEQLGRHIGYLAQDVQLFPGTIADNISRFAINPDDAEIIAAAQRAHAHELILAQRAGYQTEVGPAGAMLSGGERQRIGLARAFYGAPTILVLDEPNANLDSDGEEALGKALEEARNVSTTIIVITHRMPIAARCDRVMVLREGMIEAFGPSGEVLRNVASNRNTPAAPSQPTKPIPINLAAGISGKWQKPGASG